MAKTTTASSRRIAVRGHQITLTLGAPYGDYPHRTEDLRIDPSSIAASSHEFSGWLGSRAPEVSESLVAGFGGNLRWSHEYRGVRKAVYALPGAQCRSLIAVRVPRENLRLAQSSHKKLKAVLDDGSARYELAVSSRALKEAWRKGGIAAATEALPAWSEFHVRIGLARPSLDPSKCFAMLHGVL